MKLKASAPNVAPKIVAYYRDYLQGLCRSKPPLVFPRSPEDIRAAAGRSAFVHLECENGSIAGVMGAFASPHGVLELGGAVVTFPGYRFMRLMGRILTVQSHLNDPALPIVAVVFTENKVSIDRLNNIGFKQWTGAPAAFLEACSVNAAGRGYFVFRAYEQAIRDMARALSKWDGRLTYANDRNGQPVTVDLQHPLFDDEGRPALMRLAEIKPDGAGAE